MIKILSSGAVILAACAVVATAHSTRAICDGNTVEVTPNNDWPSGTRSVVGTVTVNGIQTDTNTFTDFNAPMVLSAPSFDGDVVKVTTKLHSDADNFNATEETTLEHCGPVKPPAPKPTPVPVPVTPVPTPLPPVPQPPKPPAPKPPKPRVVITGTVAKVMPARTHFGVDYRMKLTAKNTSKVNAVFTFVDWLPQPFMVSYFGNGHLGAIRIEKTIYLKPGGTYTWSPKFQMTRASLRRNVTNCVILKNGPKGKVLDRACDTTYEP